MTSATTFNPADVFSQDREETPQEQDAISSIDRDYDEKDTLTVDDALGQAGVKQRQKLVVDFTNKWRGTRRLGQVEVPKKDMFIMLFANEGEDPTIFDMVNNALCVRNTTSITRVRKMLLGVIQALRNLPRVDNDELFIPVSKRFKKSPQCTRGERLRCRSFVWAFTKLETALRSLPDGGTVFCVKGTSGKKVFGYDLGDLVFPRRKDEVLMNPDLCVSVENVEPEKRSSNPNPIDIVHVVVDDSVLPLLEDRFPTRTPKELYDAAMALKAATITSFSDKKHVKDLLEQASARGSIDARFQLGLCYADGFGVVPNTDWAVREITAAANDKCVDAMMWLGSRCKNGTYGTDRHPKEALEWFKKAMSQAEIDRDTEREGKAREQVSILQHWELLERQYTACVTQKKKKGEEGLNDNFREVLQGALKLANDDFPNVMGIVGYLYMNGLGTPVNSEKAVEYLKKAAEKTVTSAMNNYAICLIQGFGFNNKPNPRQAVEWFGNAARLGNVPAKVNLAHCALIGIADANVKELLEYACRYDDPHAHLTSAICYYKKIGGFPKDYGRTEFHLERAKQLGNYHAMEALDYWGHWITKFQKKEWLNLDALKWEMCVPS